MKVMVVAPVDPFASVASGVRIYTMNLISHMIKNNVTPILLGVSSSRSIKNELNFKLVPIINKNTSGYRYLFWLFIKAIFLKIDVDTVIHAQRSDYLLPFILLHKNNPKICTLHGTHIKNIYLKKGWIIGSIYEQLEKYVFRHADKIIMISSETQLYYFEKYPFLQNKSVVIPNGVNIEIFKITNKNNSIIKRYGVSNRDKVLLYVGRLEKEKRVDNIIKIFWHIKNTLPDSKLVIVGDGREKKLLQNLVRDMKLKGVIFIENLRYEEVPKIMNCADLLIMYSIHEGMPTVVLEALACGLPVVSTKVGDLNNIITTETGHIFKTTDIKEIGNIILDILTGKKISKISCVNTAKKYSWDEISKQIREIYYEVLEKK